MLGFKRLRFEFLDKVLPDIVGVWDGLLLFNEIYWHIEKFLFYGLLDACVLESQRLLAFGVDYFVI